MKLLLDENLSSQIVRKIIDLYPDSAHVKNLALKNTDDRVVWEYAKTNNFAIVSKDSDFYQCNLLYANAPKLIYLWIGESPTSEIIEVLRDNFDTICQFESSESASILVLE
jgi:predicted nuclease of predicted toxin-antitoxin system